MTLLERRFVRHRARASAVDMSTDVGVVQLKSPVMPASGAAGWGAEIAAYQPLSTLGAIVVKSHSFDSWPGNPGPRMHEATAGMLNSVGLQNKGIGYWLEHECSALESHGAAIVMSVWGRSVEEYVRVAKELSNCSEAVVALEVNLSCPNLHAGRGMFAQSESDAYEVISRVSEVTDLPIWAKLTAAVANLPSIAKAVERGGASAVTLINTVPGMAINIDARRPVLGGISGGLSGPAIHPVAVKAVYDTRQACSDLPIVGVGGVADARSALELIMAGASAVQIGTALFENPRICQVVHDDVARWCADNGVAALSELVSAAHYA